MPDFQLLYRFHQRGLGLRHRITTCQESLDQRTRTFDVDNWRLENMGIDAEWYRFNANTEIPKIRDALVFGSAKFLLGR